VIFQIEISISFQPKPSYSCAGPPCETVRAIEMPARVASQILRGRQGTRMSQVSRYHPVLVALHWLLALLVPTALVLGIFVMARIPNSDPMKAEALRGHMAGGILILTLMLLRLAIRFGTDRPASALTGSALLDGLAWVSHRLLYIGVIAMAAVGLSLAAEAGILGILFGERPHLPPDFWDYKLRVAHYLISRLLIALIALHVAGALYHTLLRRDGLLGRMWFGKQVIQRNELQPCQSAAGHYEATMQEKTVVITGASSGIGLATARELARQGALVVMVCRDAERAETARKEVAAVATGREPAVFLADLLAQREIRNVAAAINESYPRIDVLINNAGAVFARRELTVDGIEKTFAINHLAPFLLTSLLLDNIRAADAGRIITVTSGTYSSSLDFDNLQSEKGHRFLPAYFRTKLENILFTYELSRRLAGTGVTANCPFSGSD
jgi:NAD(P)-dependent dehydrogenase (short-subunit alcohol dehydrogenase family)/cytochrome b561